MGPVMLRPVRSSTPWLFAQPAPETPQLSLFQHSQTLEQFLFPAEPQELHHCRKRLAPETPPFVACRVVWTQLLAPGRSPMDSVGVGREAASACATSGTVTCKLQLGAGQARRTWRRVQNDILILVAGVISWRWVIVVSIDVIACVGILPMKPQ